MMNFEKERNEITECENKLKHVLKIFEDEAISPNSHDAVYIIKFEENFKVYNEEILKFKNPTDRTIPDMAKFCKEINGILDKMIKDYNLRQDGD